MTILEPPRQRTAGPSRIYTVPDYAQQEVPLRRASRRADGAENHRNVEGKDRPVIERMDDAGKKVRSEDRKGVPRMAQKRARIRHQYRMVDRRTGGGQESV